MCILPPRHSTRSRLLPHGVSKGLELVHNASIKDKEKAKEEEEPQSIKYVDLTKTDEVYDKVGWAGLWWGVGAGRSACVARGGATGCNGKECAAHADAWRRAASSGCFSKLD